MTLPKVAGGCLLAVTLTVLAFQRSAVSRTRQENETLRQAREEAQRRGHENETVPQLRTEREEAESLRNANRDLLRLRNEVRQLRGQSGEIEALRKENQRLALVIRSLIDGKPPRLADMEGYMAKEIWSNAGFATPESALQTFFWALRKGDFKPLTECLSPETRTSLARWQDPEQGRKFYLNTRGWAQLVEIGGYVVSEREQVSDEEVLLGVQAAAGGVVVRMSLRRSGNEWKFHDVVAAK